MKFSGVITNDKSNIHVKGQGQRSKVKVTEVKTQLNRFQTVTLVWIYIWWRNDAQSLMPNCFSRSSIKFQGHTGQKIADFDPKWAFPDCNSSLNSQMSMKLCTKTWSSIEEVSYRFARSSLKFQGHRGQKFADFDQNWVFPDCNSSFNTQMGMKWRTKLEVA